MNTEILTKTRQHADEATRESEQRYKRLIEQQFSSAAADAGLELTPADHHLFRIDLELNAQGLAFAAVRQRQKRNDKVS